MELGVLDCRVKPGNDVEWVVITASWYKTGGLLH